MSEIIGGYKFPTKLAEKIYDILGELIDNEYKNGRSAVYWNIMAVLDSHLIDNHNLRNIDDQLG